MTMINRNITPLPGKPVAFELPEIKLTKANNGTEIFYSLKNKLPIIQYVVVVSAGSRFDPADKKGLAFLTSLIIDEGAGDYNALELNNEFEKLGTMLNISADHDSFYLSILSLKENFNRSLELLSKIINEPRLEEKDFLRERKKVLDRLLQLKEEPSFIASSVFDKLIYKDSFYAYPEIGYPNSVENITTQDVELFYKNIFRNNELKIITVGDIAENEIIELTDRNNIHSNTTTNHFDFIQPGRSGTNYYFVHKESSPQAEIRIGHITPKRNEKNFYAIRIMNSILGGQFSSRINLNLREQKGFTYGAGSSFNYNQNSGSFQVSTTVNIQNTGEAVTEILKELNGIKQNITEEEIRFAKSYLVKQFPSRFETYSQTANNISPLLTHNLPIDYYKNYTQKLEDVKSEEIINAAQENIGEDNLSILVVGDKNIIVEQMKKICNENLVELDIYGNLLQPV